MNGRTNLALIDEGSESNLVDAALAYELGMTIGPRHRFNVGGIGGGVVVKGTAANMRISIGGTTTYAYFIVIENLLCKLLFRRPWAKIARFDKREFPSF